MQLFSYADRKMSLTHGENYGNNATNSKANTNGDSVSGSMKPHVNGGAQYNNNKKSKAPTNKQFSSKKQKTVRVEYEECERCGRKHLGTCNAWKHKDGTMLGEVYPTWFRLCASKRCKYQDACVHIVHTLRTLLTRTRPA